MCRTKVGYPIKNPVNRKGKINNYCIHRSKDNWYKVQVMLIRAKLIIKGIRDSPQIVTQVRLNSKQFNKTNH